MRDDKMSLGVEKMRAVGVASEVFPFGSVSTS